MHQRILQQGWLPSTGGWLDNRYELEALHKVAIESYMYSTVNGWEYFQTLLVMD